MKWAEIFSRTFYLMRTVWIYIYMSKELSIENCQNDGCSIGQNLSRLLANYCNFFWNIKHSRNEISINNKLPKSGFRIRIRIRINLSCWIRIRIQIADPDPDPHTNCGSGSGSRRTKMTPKYRKKDRIFIFWSAGCSLLKAESFSCSLGVLYGGLGVSKLQFFIKKIKIKFLVEIFFQF
jgi:hypothetical protein